MSHALRAMTCQCFLSRPGVTSLLWLLFGNWKPFRAVLSLMATHPKTLLLPSPDCALQYGSNQSSKVRVHIHTMQAFVHSHLQTTRRPSPGPQSLQSCPVRPSGLTAHHLELEEEQWTSRLASPHFPSQRQDRESHSPHVVPAA